VQLVGKWFSYGLAVVLLLATPSAFADEYAEALELVRAGQLPQAMAKVDRFLATQPKDPQMRFLKGVIQRDVGKTQDAIATFTRLTEDYPELPEPYNNLAVLYASQNQLDRARTALEMAIRTNPSYATAHENLGDVYARLASQAYSRALQIENSPTALPKLDLIRELFGSGANRGQRPNLPSALAPAVSGTPTAAGKAPPTLPAVPRAAAKPASAAASAAATQTASPGATIPTATTTATTAAATTANTTASTAPTPTPATAPSTSPAKSATATPAAPVSTAAPAAPAVANAADAASAATDEKEAASTVRAWAAAWAAKDVKAYLGFYGKGFDVPGSLSRAAWEKERRQRITSKASISVKLENMRVRTSGNQATVKFRQDYRANGLAVSSRKTLELQKSGGRWYIVKESVGE
jgi:ketosteroid isomerase-like protein